MNEKYIAIALTLALTGALARLGMAGVNDPAQGEGTLTQSPLSLGGGATPAFIMAVDDSGSMTFQTLFPGQDGQACWNNTSKSYFSGSGTNTSLNTSGSICNYVYVLPGDRINANYIGIPPLDSLGFARSPDWNPSYFDPELTYEPWVKADGTAYPNASVTATRIHPDKATTVDLFSTGIYTGTSYRAQNGMVLAAGSSYRWNNITYNVGSGGYIWALGNNADAYFDGPLAAVYLATNKTLPGYTAGVKVDNACGSGCTLWKYVPNTAATKQNFANWFSYYGNRQRAMIAGLTRSMKDVSKLNVGYFTINSTYGNVNMRDMDVPDDKKALYGQMLALGASGGTPNRNAVDHIGKQFKRTDKSAPVQTSCQKNAGMLFTDGYSNGGGPTVGNIDANMSAPFKDAHSNTLADIVTKYYLDDSNGNSPLRTDLVKGKVPRPLACDSANPDKRLDCQSNLHMNFYGITLGAKGYMFGTTYGVLADGSNDGELATEQVLSGTMSAPAWVARADDNPSTVDEIWHATMNTRGKFINATTPGKITDAMSAVLAAVAAYAGQSGSTAVSGARVDSASLSLSPSFGVDGSNWYGELEAYGLAYSPVSGKLEPALKWEASKKLPGFGSRNIYFGKTTAGVPKPAVSGFSSANITNLSDLCAGYPSGSACTTRIASLGVTKDQAISYLRGDTSQAGTGKKLRTRTTVLGDIINSSPVVSSPRDNYGYSTLLGTGADAGKNDPYNYASYLKGRAALGTSVYVGANDGMLHAFNGADGVETFAYIPATAIGYMGNLLFPDVKDFEHRYYVDGQLTVSDAMYSGAWHTVLVGASGAGGKGVFAIDVTTPNGTGANVLWEVNDKFGGDVGNRIGNVLGKPLIVPVRARSGATSWKAIFGNGYGSVSGADGSVYLFVVDIGTGAVTTISAKESSGGLSRPNGLGNLVALDRKLIANGEISQGSDGFIDTIYGGDLHGNLWRFDLTDAGSFQVGVGGKPVFTAKDSDGKRQPITGGLEAALGPKGGVMILFGTGSFMFEQTGNINDKTNDDMQTVYGVLDVGTVTATLGRSNLQEQTLNATTNFVTSNNVDYYGTKSGWYLDLSSKVKNSAGKDVPAGERVVGRPRLQGGTFLFPTYSPSSTDPCAGGGANALYGLKALTGGGDLGSFRQGPKGDPAAQGTGKMVLATGGSSPVMDIGILTSPRQDALERRDGESEAEFQERLRERLGEARCDVIVQAPGAEALYRWRACGRQSWRQVR
ncbi:MAG: pilus assembly protein [Stenotrophomonas sp.]